MTEHAWNRKSSSMSDMTNRRLCVEQLSQCWRGYITGNRKVARQSSKASKLVSLDVRSLTSGYQQAWITFFGLYVLMLLALRSCAPRTSARSFRVPLVNALFATLK